MPTSESNEFHNSAGNDYSEESLGFKPQEVPCHVRKAFPVGKSAAYMLSILKRNLGRCMETSDYGTLFTYTLNGFKMYIDLFGRLMSKEDHCYLIRTIYYILIEKEPLKSKCLYTMKDLFNRLTIKPKLLKPGDLILDWKPLFDLWIKLEANAAHFTGIPTAFDSESLLQFVRRFSYFFDVNETQAILDQVRQLKSRGITESSQLERNTFPNYYTFLPVLVPAGTFASTIGLWIDELIEDFMTEHNPDRINILLHIMQRVSHFNSGHAIWDRCIPRVLTLELNNWRVPLTLFECDRKVQIPSTFKPTRYQLKQAGHLIVHSITPTSETLNLMEKVLPALTFVCDPAVLSGQKSVIGFLKNFVSSLADRLRVERIYHGRRVPWGEQVPEHCRLTDEILERIFNMFLPILETMLYGKYFVSTVAELIGDLALIRSDLIIPRVSASIGDELKRLTEPHRVINSLEVARFIVRGAFGTSAIESNPETYFSWVLDMLPLMLEFITVNNEETSRPAQRFIYECSVAIPFSSCQHVITERNSVCRRTRELEEFVVKLTECFLNHVEETANYNQAATTNTPDRILLAFSINLDYMSTTTTSAVRRRCIDLVLQSVFGGRFSLHSPKEQSSLIKPFSHQEADYCLPLLLKKARSLIADYHEELDSAGGEYANVELLQQDINALFTVMMMIFDTSPRKLRPYYAEVLSLFRQCLTIEGPFMDKNWEYLMVSFTSYFEKFSAKLNIHDELTTSSTVLDGDTLNNSEPQTCFLKHWGLTAKQTLLKQKFMPFLEDEDYAFRDNMIAMIYSVSTEAILSSLGSSAEVHKLDREFSILSNLVLNMVRTPFMCPPINNMLERHPDIPINIYLGQQLYFDVVPDVLIGGRRFWDELLDFLNIIIDRPFNDYGIWKKRCELVSHVIAGHINLPCNLIGLKKLLKLGSTFHFDRQRRPLDYLRMKMLGYISDMHKITWNHTALCPKRLHLIERVMVQSVPSAQCQALLGSILERFMSCYPELGDYLVRPVTEYMLTLKADEMKYLSDINFARLLLVANRVRSPDSLMQLMVSFLHLVALYPNLLTVVNQQVLDSLDMNENSLRPLGWLKSSPCLDEIAKGLRQSVPHYECVYEVNSDFPNAEEQFKSANNALLKMSELLQEAKNKDLIANILMFALVGFYKGNVQNGLKLPPELAELMLFMQCTSFHPGTHKCFKEILDFATRFESPNQTLEERIVQPEELPQLCADLNCDLNDTSHELVPLATLTDKPQKTFCWHSPSYSGETSPFLKCVGSRFSDHSHIEKVLDVYLQMLRHSNGHDVKDMIHTSIWRLTLALGPQFLTEGFRETIIGYFVSKDMHSIQLGISIISGLLFGTKSWDLAGNDQCCRWLIPVLEKGIASQCFCASFSVNGPVKVGFANQLGDPRRLRVLWAHLFSELNAALPNLEDTRTNQLVILLCECLENFERWRVVPLIEHFDLFMRPIATGTLYREHHLKMISRWLTLSILPTDDKQLERVFSRTRLEAPSNWLRSLFGTAEEHEDGEQTTVPPWVCRLAYLCPNGNSSRNLGFIDILIDHLDLILTARGKTFQTNDERSRIFISRLPGLPLVAVNKSSNVAHLNRLLQKLNTILEASSTSERTVIACLSLWREVLCWAIPLLPEDIGEKTIGHLSRLLQSKEVNVVIAVSEAATELMRRNLIRVPEFLEVLQEPSLSAKACAYGLCAIINAHPHTLFPELSLVLEKMQTLVETSRKEQLNVKSIIEVAIRHFMRSHQDGWEARWKSELSNSSLTIINRLKGSSSYFS